MSRYSKYGNRKVEVDGHRFDSKAEAMRYLELKLLNQAGQISQLELQPAFELLPARKVAGQRLRKLTYVADFSYTDEDGVRHIEDVKGVETEVFRIKQKLLLHTHASQFDSGAWVFDIIKY